MAHLLDSHRLTHVKILVKQCQLLGSYDCRIVWFESHSIIWIGGSSPSLSQTSFACVYWLGMLWKAASKVSAWWSIPPRMRHSTLAVPSWMNHNNNNRNFLAGNIFVRFFLFHATLGRKNALPSFYFRVRQQGRSPHSGTTSSLFRRWWDNMY